MKMREGLREKLAGEDREGYRREARAAELEYFDRTHRFCSACGGTLEAATEISKRCRGCGAEYFPQLSPAVLVLVRRGEEALLVHAANFKRPMFALVAGFVETGETLEECVAREIEEETTLKVRNIRYFGSQSWPFPSQLMIAFTADWESGEIRFADGELTAGGWFRREDPPELPTPPSLSRRLIDAWIAGEWGK